MGKKNKAKTIRKKMLENLVTVHNPTKEEVEKFLSSIPGDDGGWYETEEGFFHESGLWSLVLPKK